MILFHFFIKHFDHDISNALVDIPQIPQSALWFHESDLKFQPIHMNFEKGGGGVEEMNRQTRLLFVAPKIVNAYHQGLSYLVTKRVAGWIKIARPWINQ